MAALADAGLLVVEQLAADAVLVVHVQELSLLLLDFFKDGLAALDLLLGGGDALAKILGDLLADFLAFGHAERNGRVVIFDCCLDEIDRLVALEAFAALVARADEVLVDPAVAFVHGVDELAAAGAAADRALEVVLVLAVALAGVPVGDEHGLDLVEQLLADERLMATLIDMAFVGDVAGVVRAAQQLVYARERQRLWAKAPGRPRVQAASLQQDGDVRQAVEARRVCLKRPYDNPAALGVDGDRAYLAAVGQRLADVQVADRCQAGCAADLDLAFDAALDLLGNLDATGCRRGGHDALQQNAVRGLLANRLLDGQELGAGFRDHATSDPMVLLVACPARDAPDNHQIDVALLCDLIDHPPERRALEQRAARDTRLDVLADHDCAMPLGKALTRLALCGDRQALGVVVGVDLPSRGHA